MVAQDRVESKGTGSHSQGDPVKGQRQRMRCAAERPLLSPYRNGRCSLAKRALLRKNRMGRHTGQFAQSSLSFAGIAHAVEVRRCKDLHGEGSALLSSWCVRRSRSDSPESKAPNEQCPPPPRRRTSIPCFMMLQPACFLRQHAAVSSHRTTVGPISVIIRACKSPSSAPDPTTANS